MDGNFLKTYQMLTKWTNKLRVNSSTRWNFKFSIYGRSHKMPHQDRFHQKIWLGLLTPSVMYFCLNFDAQSNPSRYQWERTKWTANPKKHPHFKWTANLTYGVNGHELLGWTATNSWGERPRTFGVNGHEILGWTAKTPVMNGQTAMNGQFAVKNHELVCEIVPY